MQGAAAVTFSVAQPSAHPHYWHAAIVRVTAHGLSPRVRTRSLALPAAAALLLACHSFSRSTTHSLPTHSPPVPGKFFPPEHLPIWHCVPLHPQRRGGVEAEHHCETDSAGNPGAEKQNCPGRPAAGKHRVKLVPAPASQTALGVGVTSMPTPWFPSPNRSNSYSPAPYPSVSVRRTYWIHPTRSLPPRAMALSCSPRTFPLTRRKLSSRLSSTRHNPSEGLNPTGRGRRVVSIFCDGRQRRAQPGGGSVGALTTSASASGRKVGPRRARRHHAPLRWWWCWSPAYGPGDGRTKKWLAADFYMPCDRIR